MRLMEHKGYYGTVEFSKDDQCLCGKLCFIRDLVSYDARDVGSLESEFRASVDEYLADCEEVGKAPDAPHTVTACQHPKK